MIIDDFQKIAKIIYRKDLQLSLKAGKNLLQEIHDGKPWWEKELDNEAPKRFSGAPLHFILFQYENLSLLREWKKNCREKLGLGKVVFHLSDPDCQEHIGKQCSCKPNEVEFHLESLKHVNLLLNENSRHFLENKQNNTLPLFEKHLKLFKDWLKSNNHNPNDFCIDNGTILAAYGIRESHDLDFLYENHFIHTAIPNVDCHNFFYQEIKEQLNLPFSKNEIIHNPQNHFYYKGIKFCKLSILEEIKKSRLVDGKRREKDERDYLLIQEFKSKNNLDS